MSHIHFDLVGGMAGDMTVAALVDAGADFRELRTLLERSDLPVTDMTWTREWRGGLAGGRFAVAPEANAPARTWRDIRGLLEGSALSPRSRELSGEIFLRLARAEAETHGCSLEEVHFHEVGAMDSIVDIVATAIAVELLDGDSFSCSKVPVCLGSIQAAHGVLPLPAPATARLLLGFHLYPIPGTLETVTPTGAAILAALCGAGGGSLPSLRLERVGTGMGSAELPDRPNVLRVLVGRAHPRDERRADAVVIEATIDDMDPRLYGDVAANLFAAGALDVALVPAQMKKHRPGTLLQVVARPELEGVLTGLLLRETTTLGVRSHDVRRTELERRTEPVRTRFGEIRVKRGFLAGECVNVSPEYEDCVARAREHGVPVKDVLKAALAATEEQGSASLRGGAGGPQA